MKNSYDNDFFFVLGNLLSPLDETVKKELNNKINSIISNWNDVHVEMNKSDLSIVQYKDTKLENAKNIKLDEAMNRINEIERSYPELKYSINWLNTPDTK